MQTGVKRWMTGLLAGMLMLCAGFTAAETMQEGVPFGSPWINGMVIGNLPAEAPSPKDDLYLSINYDEIAAHQSGMYNPMETSPRLQEEVVRLIHDESFTAPGMDQLRIFWKQAADTETLKREGLSGVQPYIDRIMAAQSIDELNRVLLADDFPFSPYIFMTVLPENLKGCNIVGLMPALALSDDPLQGIEMYGSPASTADKLNAYSWGLNLAGRAGTVLRLMGIDSGEVPDRMLSLFNLEVSYAWYYPSMGVMIQTEYGAMEQFAQILSREETETLCSSFPLAGTLKKFGKDASPRFYVGTRAWLEALDSLWTDENLEDIRILTAYKVMTECSSYVSPEFFNRNAPVPLIAEGNALRACDRAPTFSSLMAQVYSEYVLGSGVKDKLTEVTCGLLEEYRKMFLETEWISEETRADAITKIDNLQLNILGPKEGYMDYSALELKTTEEGGTLLGNYLAIKAYRNELDNRLIGEPARADLFWRSSVPSTVNCFYDQTSNSINILPNYISAVYWWDGITEMEILGGIGAVIGHEIGHAFDFLGSQFDGYAFPKAILHDDDVDEFLARISRVSEYYSRITVMPDLRLDGEMMRTENAADLAGVRAALSLAAKQENVDFAAFFRQFAKSYVGVADAEMLRMFIPEDNHAPQYVRVNVISQMMPEYAEIYGVQEGDGMYVKPEDRLVIWGNE